jgi:hypothetical protein
LLLQVSRNSAIKSDIRFSNEDSIQETVSHSNSARPLKIKGKATRAAILDAAHEVFKTTGYYGSSI